RENGRYESRRIGIVRRHAILLAKHNVPPCRQLPNDQHGDKDCREHLEDLAQRTRAAGAGIWLVRIDAARRRRLPGKLKRLPEIVRIVDIDSTHLEADHLVWLAFELAARA